MYIDLFDEMIYYFMSGQLICTIGLRFDFLILYVHTSCMHTHIYTGYLRMITIYFELLQLLQ